MFDRKWKRYARAVEEDCEVMADRAVTAEQQLREAREALERIEAGPVHDHSAATSRSMQEIARAALADSPQKGVEDG